MRWWGSMSGRIGRENWDEWSGICGCWWWWWWWCVLGCAFEGMAFMGSIFCSWSESADIRDELLILLRNNSWGFEVCVWESCRKVESWKGENWVTKGTHGDTRSEIDIDRSRASFWIRLIERFRDVEMRLAAWIENLSVLWGWGGWKDNEWALRTIKNYIMDVVLSIE